METSVTRPLTTLYTKQTVSAVVQGDWHEHCSRSTLMSTAMPTAVRGQHQEQFVDIRGDGIDTRHIVNLHGQIYPGVPRCHRHTQSKDHAEQREQYFQSALTQLTAKLVRNHTNHITIVFPHNIGCGLARGSWTRYYAMIKEFTKNINRQHPAGATVEIWHYNPSRTTKPRRRR